MGNAQHGRERVPCEAEDEARRLFVVPSTLRLSPEQLAELTAAGQSPGVPFVISETGLSRPTLTHIRKTSVANLVAVQRESPRFIPLQPQTSRHSFSLSFVYDAVVPAKAIVYIKARDAGSNDFALDSHNIVWGPLELPQGHDLTWNSADAGLLLSEADILEWRHKPPRNKDEGRRRSKGRYDLAIHVFPSAAEHLSLIHI